MSKSTVQTIARILKVLVTVTFVCNLLALLLVPGLVYFRFDLEHIQALWAYESDDCFWNFVDLLFLWWLDANPYITALTLFLWAAGICTAAILWQGRRVLDTILRGTPFCPENAVSLRRAAVCSFVISLAALARLIFSLYWFRSPAPLVSYNALFVPIFAMFGLLCLVMAALFGQAAEIKAENDLTI